MPFSARAAWDVRPINDSGASDTERWQQNAEQYDVAAGPTPGTATITSATATFRADVVGNMVYVGGDLYEVVRFVNETTVAALLIHSRNLSGTLS